MQIMRTLPLPRIDEILKREWKNTETNLKDTTVPPPKGEQDVYQPAY
jgi:hypothetical protein